MKKVKVGSISFTSKYKVGALHWVDIQRVEGEDKGEGSQKRKTRPSFTVFFRPLRVSRKLFSQVKAFEGIAFTPNSPRMREILRVVKGEGKKRKFAECAYTRVEGQKRAGTSRKCGRMGRR